MIKVIGLRLKIIFLAILILNLHIVYVKHVVMKCMGINLGMKNIERKEILGQKNNSRYILCIKKGLEIF